MDKLEFEKNGYIILKTSLSDNKLFQDILKKIDRDIEREIIKPEIKKLSGFIMGNLNVYPGNYGSQLLGLLKSDKNILDKIENILGKKIESYNINFGGNLSLPQKGKQLFHIDGVHGKEMNLVSIATENITENNGPTEVCIGTHKINYDYKKFLFTKKRKKKLCANIGDIIIRKHDLWHRGTINFSKKPRFLFSLLFFPKDSAHYISVPKTNDLKINPNFFKNNFIGKMYEIIYVKFNFLIIISKLFFSIINKK